MATTLAALETIVRRHLREATARYWSSDELIALMALGIRDLWRGVDALHLNHFCTVDITNVSLAADTTTLTGIPSDCVRVHMLEPRDLSSTSTSRNWKFEPLPYNDPKFQAARMSAAQDATQGGVIYWAVRGAGGPVSAPTIDVAPTVDTAINLAFTYVPNLGTFTSASNNPIPGEADNALVCWTVAYARAKEREDSAPDPTWLGLYATEKENLITSLAPRQNQEETTVRAMFEEYWA